MVCPFYQLALNHNQVLFVSYFRIFDYLLSSPPHSILYLCSAVLLMIDFSSFCNRNHSSTSTSNSRWTMTMYWLFNIIDGHIVCIFHQQSIQRYQWASRRCDIIMWIIATIISNTAVPVISPLIVLTFPINRSSLIIDNYLDKLSINSRLTNNEI